MQRLFIYGTLAPGRNNHKVMEGISGTWETATLRGTLIQEGWGAKMGFPGIIPAEDGDEVAGFVFSSKYLEDHWRMLDEFEGEGYERVLVTVRVDGEHDVEAFVYALNKKIHSE